MRRPRGRFWRTLRFRLTMWNVALVLVTSLATVFALREGVRFALLRETDAVLKADLREIRLAMEAAPPPDLAFVKKNLHRKALGHEQQGWFVELLDRNQQLLWASGPRHQQSSQAVAEAEPQNEFRAYSESIRPMAGVAIIRVGASLESINADMKRIDRLAVLIGSLALIVAPIGGYLLAVRAIRPLTHVTMIASKLAPQKLEQRLPHRNTGDELDLLSQTVNRLLDRIAAHLQQRHDLLANSAHELRSPLAAIRSCVEVALNDGRSVADYHELLIDLMGQCEGLETLVNQLLLLAETEAPEAREKAERVPWSDIVQSSIDMFSAAADVAGVRLTAAIEPDIHVDGNRQHLRQVINNLLDNAIKYTPPGSSVKIELSRVKDEALLRVLDTGSGINVEDLPRIFERFYRGDKGRCREPLKQGTGLGLSICKSVVDALDGKITVDSQPQRGTAVTVVLPLSKSAAAVSHA